MEKIKNIDVLILCGGKGRRLKKITGKTPKPMVRIGKRVFLDILIDYLRSFGFRRFILGVGYQAQFIINYYNRRKVSGRQIVFCRENKPLGTGGAVKNAKRFIKSRDFLVLNGDTFSKFDARDFVKFYKRKKAKLLVLLRKVESGGDYGLITVNKKLRVAGFNEKTPSGPGCYVNAGVYLFNKSIFSQMPKKAFFSLEYDFFPLVAKKDFYGYKKSGFFIDIGTPDRFMEAKKYFAEA